MQSWACLPNSAGEVGGGRITGGAAAHRCGGVISVSHGTHLALERGGLVEMSDI